MPFSSLPPSLDNCVQRKLACYLLKSLRHNPPGWNDPENVRIRAENRKRLEAIWAKRDAEAKPLLDDLRKYNLDFESIDQIQRAPENALILAIDRMVEYIDIFEDCANQMSLALALSRPEGIGFVAKPMIRRFESLDRNSPTFLNDRFQAAKAIRATAEKDDLEHIERLVFDPTVHISSRREFLSAVTRLQKSRVMPLLEKCLHMDEETILEALKRLSRYKQLPDEISVTVRKLQNHPNPKVQKLAKKISLS